MKNKDIIFNLRRLNNELNNNQVSREIYCCKIISDLAVVDVRITRRCNAFHLIDKCRTIDNQQRQI